MAGRGGRMSGLGHETREGHGLAVRVQDLHATYDGSVQALRGLDLSVTHGGAVAVVGPSGSGKSTLLHCLAGLVEPDRGTVEVAGIDVTRLSDRGRRQLRRSTVGLIFQDGQLLPELDVTANVALPLRLAGRSRSAATEAAEATLASLGLHAEARRDTRQLSGGQLQRVAVARALVTNPTVLLADEPTGALDQANRDLVMDLLMKVAADTTLIMVTHDPALAERCDRTLSMRDGVIV